MIIVSMLLIYGLLGWKLVAVIQKMLIEHKITAINFNGRNIPNSMGVFIWVMLIIYCIFVQVLEPYLSRLGWNSGVSVASLTMVTLAASIIFITGWFDDCFGRKDIKGLKGHFHHLLSQQILTSGSIKAIVTFVVSLWVVIDLEGFAIQNVCSLLVLITTTNLFNLLDVRPGRSIKMFMAVVIALFLIPTVVGLLSLNAIIYLWPIMTAALFVLPDELKQAHMLGDSGANLLGFMLGYAWIVAFPIIMQAVWLLLTLWLHWIAESSSISRLIDRNRLLSWMDRIGRRMPTGDE